MTGWTEYGVLLLDGTVAAAASHGAAAESGTAIRHSVMARHVAFTPTPRGAHAEVSIGDWRIVPAGLRPAPAQAMDDHCGQES